MDEAAQAKRRSRKDTPVPPAATGACGLVRWRSLLPHHGILLQGVRQFSSSSL
jgi:hypothetical protein